MDKSKKLDRSHLPPTAREEAYENQLISLAMNLVEKRLRNGTATSNEVVHFLKLGSSKEKLEKQILEKNKALITAKTESLEYAKKSEESFQKVLACMRKYRGEEDNGEFKDV